MNEEQLQTLYTEFDTFSVNAGHDSLASPTHTYPNGYLFQCSYSVDLNAHK